VKFKKLGFSAPLNTEADMGWGVWRWDTQSLANFTIFQ